MSTESRSHRVALIGLPGAGKTAVAPGLAARLGCPWADLDADVERAAGRTIGGLLEREGEAAFRARELEALRTVLAAGGPLVLACGGGVVTHAPSCEALRAGATVVWLRVSPGFAASRLGPDGLAARPLLAAAGGAVSAAAGEAALAALLDVRAALYAAAADVTVETDGRGVDESAEEAAAVLRKRWANSES
jgi:shikimate kinase